MRSPPLPPPTSNRPSVDLLVDFIASVSACAPDLPYYYYHIPRMSVSPDLVEFMQKACERVPRFNGIKFSDFFLADLTTCLEFEDGRLDALFGSDEMILGALPPVPKARSAAPMALPLRSLPKSSKHTAKER